MATRRQAAAGDSSTPEAGIDKFAAVMERFLEKIPAAGDRRESFKVPKYDGKSDVEQFIRQFMDVAEASHWSEQACLIHLREALQGGALDCAKYDTIPKIIDALRAKFGMSAREARRKLTSLNRDQQTKLQEHASHVERLMEVAYPDLPRTVRNELAVDTFMSTIGNRDLQRHLLAIQLPSIEAAVRAGNEYLQVPAGPNKYRIRMVEDMELDDINSIGQEESVLKAVRELSVKMDNMEKRLGKVESQVNNKPTPHHKSDGERQAKIVSCWNCNKEGHYSRQCPQKKRVESGNAPHPHNH